MEETVSVVTLKEHQYDGKKRSPGERYQAFMRDLRLITALGWVREKLPDPVKNPDDPPPPQSPAKPKARYKRRDLRAE